MKALYETGVENSGFVFKVVQNDPTKPISESHVVDFVAEGQSLKNLNAADRKRVFAAIYEKEKSIALRLPASGKIRLEKDRHGGNFKVDLSKDPPVIYVFDFPLLSEVDVADARAVFRILGLAATLKGKGMLAKTGVLNPVFDEVIANLRQISTQPELLNLPENRKLIEKTLLEASARNGASPVDVALEVMATANGQKSEIKDSVYEYLDAVINLEMYSHAASPPGRDLLMEDVEAQVRESLEPFRQRFFGSDDCKRPGLLGRILKRFAK